MPKIRLSGQVLGMVWLLSVLTVSTLAQATCPQVVDLALSSLENNCAGLGRNEACYAYNQVSASFVGEVDDDFFAEPADRSPVIEIASIATAALDLNTDTWGVALLQLQANLPNTIPGQNVSVLLVGDSEVENAVASDAAVDFETGVDVELADATQARSGPGSNFNVLGSEEAGAVLRVDRLDETEMWLRAVVGDSVAWISRDAIVQPEPEDVAALPVATGDLRTPMQSFFLRNGIGRVQCEETPDVLLVQGPENVEIDLSVNGANIRLGSTILIRILPPGNIMEIIVIDGQVEILDENFEPTGVIIRTGERSEVELGEPADLGQDGVANDRLISGEFSDPEPTDLDFWCSLGAVNPAIINYEIDLTCAPETSTASTSASTSSSSSQQRAPAPEPEVTQDPNPSQIEGVDCTNFAIPDQTVIATNFILDWPDVPGATDYIVAVFDNQGFQLEGIPTTESQLLTNGGIFPSGGYVDVWVYQNGEYACFARLVFSREGNPNPVSFFTASFTCLTNSASPGGRVTWSNAPQRDVKITWYDSSFGSNGRVNAIGSEGSVKIFGFSIVDVRVQSGDEIIPISKTCP